MCPIRGSHSSSSCSLLPQRTEFEPSITSPTAVRHLTQFLHPARFAIMAPHLSNQLNNTTGLLDLLLSVPAEVSGADNDGDLGDTAFAQNLRVTQGEEVDDGGGVGLLAAQVGFASLGRDEGPQLVEVDGGLPELLVGLVEVSHTNLTEVTRVELVKVGTVVVLTTGQTTTTWVLTVLANATVTGRHMTASFSCLRKTGRHLVDGAVLDKTGLRFGDGGMRS